MTTAIITAAGRSLRMRAWKMLLPFKNGAIIDYALEAAEGAADRVILVAGYRAEELKSHIQQKKQITLAVNTHYENGMFSSIQRGAAELTQGEDLFFVLHGDLPLVTSEHIRGLLGVFAEHPDYDILQPVSGKTPGHPVLFRGSVRNTILSLAPESSMREVFAEHAVLRYESDNPVFFTDIDTPAAYKRLIGKI